MSGQNLANTSWALATLRAANEDFFDAVAQAVTAQCHEFAQQSLGPTCFLPMFHCHFFCRWKSHHLYRRNLSNTAWAFAKVQIKRPEMMATIASKVQRVALPAQGVANTVGVPIFRK